MLRSPPEKTSRAATRFPNRTGFVWPWPSFWVVASDDPSWADQAAAVCRRCVAVEHRVVFQREASGKTEDPRDRILARWPLTDLGSNLLRQVAAQLPAVEVVVVIDHSRAGAEMQAELSDLDVIPLGLGDWKRAAGEGEPGWIPMALRPRACRARLAVAELDRLARLEIIERQGEEIGRLHREIQRWIADLESVAVNAFERGERVAELSRRLADLNGFTQ